VISTVVARHPEAGLDELLSRPLPDVAAVRFRQAVVRDLQSAPLLGAVREFCRSMAGGRHRREVLSSAGDAARWQRLAQVTANTADYVRATTAPSDGPC